MSPQTATKADLQSLEKRSNKKFAKIDARFDSFEQRIDARFDELISTINTFATDVYRRFDEHDEELRKLNDKYDHLVETIDGFIGRINRYEAELVARDSKIARLERWIEQIADQTGAKLT